MRWAKQIRRNRFHVADFDGEFVTLALDDPEYEMDMPAGDYIRMFGRDHLKQGYYGTVVLKERADGRIVLRGWPDKRKWTAEEIAEAERKAELLAEALNIEWI